MVKLLEKFTNQELNLLKDIGIYIEDREYEKNEIIEYEMNIENYIMGHSSKNGDIARLTNQYNSILNTIIKCQ